MIREQIVSLQEDLRLFVMQTQSRLAEARKSIQEMKVSHCSKIDVPSNIENCQHSPELLRSADATDRLEAIKRRLAVQIENA